MVWMGMVGARGSVGNGGLHGSVGVCLGCHYKAAKFEQLDQQTCGAWMSKVQVWSDMVFCEGFCPGS